MHIAIVTTVHKENDVRIYHKEALSLAKNYDVTLIAPRKTKVDINFLKYIPLNPPINRIQRLYLQFKVFTIIKRIRPDVVHMHDPELFLLGAIFKKWGLKVVWDVHESLPGQIHNKNWIPKPLRSLISLCASALEYMSGRLFDRIIAATHSIGRSFPASKTEVVQNFPILDEMNQGGKIIESEGSEHSIFFHGGGLTKIRGVDKIIEAARIANEDLGCHTRIRLVGQFESEEFKSLCMNLKGWVYTEYHEWVERDRLAELLMPCHAGIVTFLPVPNHLESQPNKIFEYMSAAKPVIVSNFPLWEEIIISGNISGMLVDPQSSYEIAKAMEFIHKNPKMAEDMGKSGLKKVNTEYNWESQASILNKVYDSLNREIK